MPGPPPGTPIWAEKRQFRPILGPETTRKTTDFRSPLLATGVGVAGFKREGRGRGPHVRGLGGDLGWKGGKWENLELGARSEFGRRPLAHPGLPEVSLQQRLFLPEK